MMNFMGVLVKRILKMLLKKYELLVSPSSGSRLKKIADSSRNVTGKKR